MNRESSIGNRESGTVNVEPGEKDKAFEWLERDFKNHSDLGKLTWYYCYEPLRDDPRYKDLVKRMGLPE